MGNFEVLCQDSHSQARRGLLTTSHGKVETPAFIPVGTVGAVKGISPQQLKETGADIVLASDPDCDRIGCAAPLSADHQGQPSAA